MQRETSLGGDRTKAGTLDHLIIVPPFPLPEYSDLQSPCYLSEAAFQTDRQVDSLSYLFQSQKIFQSSLNQLRRSSASCSCGSLDDGTEFCAESRTPILLLDLCGGYSRGPSSPALDSIAVTVIMDSKFTGYGDVLMVPVGLKGHIDPLIYVAKGLIRYGLTITMVVQEDLRSLIDKDIEDQILGLRIQTVPTVRVQWPLWASVNAKKSCEPYFNKLLADRQSGAAPGPKCIIADMLQAWTQEWADKLELPRYVSCPSPATFGLTMHCFSTLMSKGLLQGTDPDPVLDVPGTPALHLSDLPPMVRHMPRFMTENGNTFKDSAGMLINTLYELEPRAVDTFQAEVKAASTRAKVTKMYTIGPMLPAEFFSQETFVGSQDDSETIRWLNTRLDRSVLYVAFGSMAYLEPKEIVELAYGLETSEVSFLWILRLKGKDGEPAADVNEVLPSGFRERTKDRGLIYTEFAPQLQILSHPATGGFLTHCGWNSSLESICRGVPMLGWPMHAEQGLNCRILVDEAKVATEIKKGPGGVVERAEVAEGVKRLMAEPLGKQLKERVLKLQLQARMAVAPGGSTYKNFESLVKEIQSSPSASPNQ